MHSSVQNLLKIENQIKLNLMDLNINKLPKIIAVSKTFKIDKILPLIDHGHEDFGENKVQEAVEKWTMIKEKNSNIKLHMIGKLQTNKVKLALKIFDFIHSVDSKKLAKKIADEQLNMNKKIKIFIQINVGDEIQKSGVHKDALNDLVFYCNELKLNVLGFMCIPPVNVEPEVFFKEIKKLKENFHLSELSMGMSSDYLVAAKNSSSYLRIGSSIFGKRF